MPCSRADCDIKARQGAAYATGLRIPQHYVSIPITHCEDMAVRRPDDLYDVSRRVLESVLQFDAARQYNIWGSCRLARGYATGSDHHAKQAVDLVGRRKGDAPEVRW